MPWDAQDAQKHNKGAKGRSAKQWASVANSALKKYGDDGRAVKIANAAIQRRRMNNRG